jgi:hypothetical protein
VAVFSGAVVTGEDIPIFLFLYGFYREKRLYMIMIFQKVIYGGRDLAVT